MPLFYGKTPTLEKNFKQAAKSRLIIDHKNSGFHLGHYPKVGTLTPNKDAGSATNHCKTERMEVFHWAKRRTKTEPRDGTQPRIP